MGLGCLPVDPPFASLVACNDIFPKAAGERLESNLAKAIAGICWICTSLQYFLLAKPADWQTRKKVQL